MKKKFFSPLNPILNDFRCVFCIKIFFKSNEKIFWHLNIMKKPFKNSKKLFQRAFKNPKKLFQHAKQFFSPLTPILNDLNVVFALKYYLTQKEKKF